MVDIELREFLISQLKEKNLPLDGSIRTLQRRYQNALEAEDTNDTVNAEDTNDTVNAEDTNVTTNADLDPEFSKSYHFDPLFDVESEDECAEQNEKVKKLKKKSMVNNVQTGIKPIQKQSAFISPATNDQTRNQSKNANKSKKKKRKSKKKKDKPYRLYVGNVNYRAVEENVREEFQKFAEVGHISEVVIPRKPTRKLGFAFVTFTSTEDGEKARQKMHNKKVWGRILNCAKAKVPKAVDLARKKAFVQREKEKLLKIAADAAKDESKSAGKKKRGKRQKTSEKSMKSGGKSVDKSPKKARRNNGKKISKVQASKQPTISPSKKSTSRKRKSNKVPQRTSKRRKK